MKVAHCALLMFVHVAATAQVGSLIGGVVGGAVGGLVGKNATKPRLSQEQLEAMAVSINRSLPKQIDPTTRLDLVTIESGLRVVYSYTFPGHSVEDISLADFYGILGKEIRAKACSDPNTKSMLDRGAKLVWTYRDRNKKQVGTISVTKKECV